MARITVVGKYDGGGATVRRWIVPPCTAPSSCGTISSDPDSRGVGLGPSFSLVDEEVEWYEGEMSVAMGGLSVEDEARRRRALWGGC